MKIALKKYKSLSLSKIYSLKIYILETRFLRYIVSKEKKISKEKSWEKQNSSCQIGKLVDDALGKDSYILS